MAHAVIENGAIKQYGTLPKSYHSIYGNVLGGFDRLSDEELAKHGFYPIEDCIIDDPLFKTKGNLYFDKSNNVFKHNIVDVEHPSVEVLKESKLNAIEFEKKQILKETDYKVIEALELDQPIDDEIKQHRLKIREAANTLKKEVSLLNTKRDLLLYNKNIEI